MDLNFLSDDGNYEFEMEVEYNDSVLQIKEKIEKKMGIPIANQTLTFLDEILADEFNLQDSDDIVDKSWIVIKIDPPWERETEILLKFPMSPVLVRLQKVDVNQTVSQLKVLITSRFEQMATTPADRIVLKLNNVGTELEDSRTLHECQIKRNSIVAVHLKLRARKKVNFD